MQTPYVHSGLNESDPIPPPPPAGLSNFLAKRDQQAAPPPSNEVSSGIADQLITRDSDPENLLVLEPGEAASPIKTAGPSTRAGRASISAVPTVIHITPASMPDKYSTPDTQKKREQMRTIDETIRSHPLDDNGILTSTTRGAPPHPQLASYVARLQSKILNKPPLMERTASVAKDLVQSSPHNPLGFVLAGVLGALLVVGGIFLYHKYLAPTTVATINASPSQPAPTQ